MLRLISKFMGSEATPVRVRVGGPHPAPDILEQDERSPYEVICHGPVIERLLRRLLESGIPLWVTPRARCEPFESRLRHFDVERGQLLIAQRWNEVDHEALLEDGHVNLSAELDGSPIFFTLDVLGVEQHAGTPCYRLAIPSWALRMQMRQCLRIPLTASPVSRLLGVLDDRTLLEARLFDISEGGVGFVMDATLARHIQIESRIEQVDLESAQGNLPALTLVVRHIDTLPSGMVVVGAAIVAATEVQLNSLRRLILSLQKTLLRVN
jgi:c-di-GMP-binding flagellar brake protein YcgR